MATGLGAYDPPVTVETDRDPADVAFGDAFERYWAPIIAPSARGILDRLDGAALGEGAAAAPSRIVDVGTGTGTLAIAALERWPDARAIGIDPSPRMLEHARRSAEQRGHGLSERLELVVGFDDELPVPDRSADLVVSSFVIQLVENREWMLSEIRRVLRPGGTVALVTWRGKRDSFEPDRVVTRAFDELRIPPDDEPDDTNPYESVDEAEDEFRAAGFEQVEGRSVWLDHAFTADEYLAVSEHWFDRETFEDLAEPMRSRLRDLLRARLGELSPDALRWRRDLVSVVARRSA